MAEDFRYRAFISYSHADEAWAKWLHRALESYRVPAKVVAAHSLPGNRLIPVFRDREELASSGDLSATIQAALAASDNLIVICSKQAAQSRWVNEEIAYFAKLGRSERILCLLIDDPDVSFPPAVLAPREGAESGHLEPLAADPRRAADGRRGALLKIVAGLLGVGLDDLRRRELLRRQRRMAALLAVSLVVAGATTGLAVFALYQKQIADGARERAEIEATSASEVAEFLTGLFKVSDPAQALGRAVTARELLDVGARRIDEQLSASPLVRARLLRVMGDVYRSLGLFEEALTLLDRSVAAYRALVAPGDSERLHAERLLAELYLSRGETARARALLTPLLATSEAAWGPAHPETALVLYSLAYESMVHGDLVAALDGLRRALAVQDVRLAADDPQKAHTLLRIAGTATELGELVEARAAAERAVDIYRRNYGDVHPDTQSALTILSGIYVSQGEERRGAETLELALHEAERILGPDHPRLAGRLNELGIQYGYADRGEEAVLVFERVLRIFESAYGADSPGAALSRGNLAWAQHVSGQLDLAEQTFEVALEQVPDDAMKAVVLLDYARLELDRGDYRKALFMLEECVAIRTAARGPDNEGTRECAAERDRARARLAEDTQPGREPS